MNRAVLRRYFNEVVNQRNVTLANDLLSPVYVNHTAGGGIGTGRAGFVQSLTALLTTFPDWHITVEEMVAVGWYATDALHQLAAALVPTAQQ